MELKKVEFKALPIKEKMYDFLNAVKDYLFPNYYNEVKDEKEALEKCQKLFKKYISEDEKLEKAFFEELKNAYKFLLTDLEMTYNSDPACISIEEALITYPGIYAIITYRISHILYKLGLKVQARIISEEAHSRTGIDIHPGAVIDNYFFIDHGTGIVIGETTIIGNHVKIYQGVTLGALSLKDGHAMAGTKRHPTIGNNVTIYSGASILGGETVIGDNCTIGSNTFIIKSIESNTKVLNKDFEVIYKNND